MYNLHVYSRVYRLEKRDEDEPGNTNARNTQSHNTRHVYITRDQGITRAHTYGRTEVYTLTYTLLHTRGHIPIYTHTGHNQ